MSTSLHQLVLSTVADLPYQFGHFSKLLWVGCLTDGHSDSLLLHHISRIDHILQPIIIDTYSILQLLHLVFELFIL